MSDIQPTEAEREATKRLRNSIPERGPKGGIRRFVFELTDEQAATEISRIRADAVKAEREKYRRGCPNCEDGLFDEVSCGVGFCLSCGGVAILSDDQEAPPR